MREIVLNAAYFLPVTAVVFIAAWFLSVFFPLPKPKWWHGLLAFPVTLLVVTLVAPNLMVDPHDYRGLATPALLSFFVGLLTLWALPRLLGR